MTFSLVFSFLIIILSFIIVATFIVVFFCLNMIYVNIKTLVPWARAPMSGLNYILDELNLPPQSLVYDLGCGDGRFLFLAEKKGLRAIGYELAIYPYLKAHFKKFILASDVVIEHKNFFKQDFGKADAIFIFLTASVMENIGQKLRLDLARGTRIISYGFEIPHWPVSRILETKPSKTYIY